MDDDLHRDSWGSGDIQSDDDDRALLGTPKRRNWTPQLLLAITACVTGASFQFGYYTGVLNAPQKVIEEFLNTTHQNRTGEPFPESTITLLWSVIVSVFCVGGMIGGFSAGFFANYFGRKGAMLMNNILAFIGIGLMSGSKYAASYEMLIAGRFVMGICAGVCTGVAPLYLSEVAPTCLRGAAGVINQLVIVIAVLISEVLGLSSLLGNEKYWPLLLAFGFIPCLVQLTLLPFCPESPRYSMIVKNQEHSARTGLQKLRAIPDVEDELLEIKAEMEAAIFEDKVTFWDLFRKRYLITPLIISVVMQLSQQLSGVNAVIYYSTSIFHKANLSLLEAEYATLGVGGINVLMTFISVLLIERAGRRTLHLTGLGGMFIFTIVITISFVLKDTLTWMSYISVVSVIFYIVFFAIGPGSIPWFIVAELFDQGPRNHAISIAVLVNWLAQVAIGLGYPQLQTHLKDYSFIPFSVLLALFWVFTYIKVPETKGKTIEQITMTFKDSLPKKNGERAQSLQSNNRLVGDI